MMLSTSELYQICMKIYENVSGPVSWFVLPMFLIRVSVAQLSGDSAEIRAAIKGLVMYFVLILSFGMILDLLLQIPQSFIPDVNTEAIAAKTRKIIQQEQSTWEIAKKKHSRVDHFCGRMPISSNLLGHCRISRSCHGTHDSNGPRHFLTFMCWKYRCSCESFLWRYHHVFMLASFVVRI